MAILGEIIIDYRTFKNLKQIFNTLRNFYVDYV